MDLETRLRAITQDRLTGETDYSVTFTSDRKKGIQAELHQVVGTTKYHEATVKADKLEDVMTKLERAHKKSRRARAGLVSSLFAAASRR